MRHWILPWLLLSLSLVVPVAAEAPASVGESARLVVQNTTTRMLAVLKAEQDNLRQHPERIYDLVDEIVLPHFDFARMSRWVLGKYWREASEEQRARFVEEFRNLLVRTYATALLEYSNQAVEVLPLRGDAQATEVVVRTEVKQPGAYPIPINYSMNVEGGDWKVYDVTIDGISLVASYRSTFGNEAARGGVQRVIALLEERNRSAKP
jgi:phospholipid transport system substrate-binding protein